MVEDLLDHLAHSWPYQDGNLAGCDLAGVSLGEGAVMTTSFRGPCTCACRRRPGACLWAVSPRLRNIATFTLAPTLVKKPLGRR